ncbi:MAG TPA: hypothetical protein VF392_15645 [Terracidiphilus sp.]
MTILLMVLGFLVLSVIVAALNAYFGDFSNLLDDLRNRNDRGNLKRPSEKYVSR